VRTLFAGVRVVDGISDAASEAMDVLVDGERIAEVRRSGALPVAPDDVVVVDGGRTLLPGLIDAHAHYTFDPTEGSLQAISRRTDEAILAAAERHAALALRAGVTTARGAGSIRGLELTLRDRIAAGATPGPRILAAGLAVGAPDGHGVAFAVGARGAADLADATRRVVDTGADVVKVVASEAAMLTTTGHESPREVFGRPELALDELVAIVETAHAAGRRVMAHAQDGESVRRCVAAGVDSVEHAWLADPADLGGMAAAGTYLVPTLVVTDVNRTLDGLTPAQRARQDLIERRHRAATEAAIARGIPVATGTDTGEVGVTADMVVREIALLVAHGATPMAAIHTATSGAARLLGLDAEVGTVRPGMRADLLLIGGDPLADPSALAAPVGVWKAGVRVV
jgi:imidazolonepropionase-like amidohydrolase